MIHIRLDELLRVLKSVMNKHQNLNSVDLQNAAEMLTAKVKGKKGVLKWVGEGRKDPNDTFSFITTIEQSPLVAFV